MGESTEELIAKRKEKVINFLKKRSNLVTYFLLAVIVYIAVWIRTRNLYGLRDITTGGWTLGPDLDPFLFLRYAKYIVENGSLFALDTMRYVPLGFETGIEFPLLHNSIAWFHKIAVLFGSSSVEQSAAIYPVFMFSLTIISFFFLTREIFSNITSKNNSNYIGLIASIFLSILPIFIPRTIAGIPEKESAAFLFFFAAFYFFLVGWRTNKENKSYLISFIGGVFAGLMALTWGGFVYINLILSLTVMTLFLFNQIDFRKTVNYTIFILTLYVLQIILFERITLSNVVYGFDSIFAFTSIFILWMNIFLKDKGKKLIIKPLKEYPLITSIIYSIVVLGILGAIVLGPSFVLNNISSIYTQLTGPATSRLIQTVAENRQPFFVEWAYNFGPQVGGIPSLLIISFLASIILIYKSLKETPLIKKDKIKIVVAWALFLFAVTYTRYNENSIFNGTNFVSKLVYFAGLLAPLICFSYISFTYKRKGELNIYRKINIAYVFTLIFFVIGLISSRTYIRLVLMLAPIASILLGYIAVKSTNSVYRSFKSKDYLNYKTAIYALVIIGVIFSGYAHIASSKNLAENYVPSSYNQQWQKAMSWVRENTPTNAVFGHWWDYGYWIQSIGERATVLDGGNLIGYWNHLMGRHALTETDFSKTLEFLYSHNVTHFLIDSTDIGKYSAFSTIGSDASYDRRSWIPTLLRDNSQTAERKNTTLFVYPAGTSLDEDITYNLNGTNIFLPAGKAYLAAVVVAVSQEDESVSDVMGVYFLQDKTYQIPLRYYWEKSIGFVDRGAGVDAGIAIYPRVITNSQGGGDVEPRGALLYLSSRTVKSNLARFYIYGEVNENFKLVHSEEDYIVNILKSQGLSDLPDFVYFNEFRGPIRIWEINYPSNTKVNEEFLKTEYPADLLFA